MTRYFFLLIQSYVRKNKIKKEGNENITNRVKRNILHYKNYYIFQIITENPIVFNAKNTPQYIYSPYDNDDLYPENCDCQFVILASTLQHRIQITIIESEMEEPLFTECNDYCVIHNGKLFIF